jgi:hypothetical protein
VIARCLDFAESACANLQSRPRTYGLCTGSNETHFGACQEFSEELIGTHGAVLGGKRDFTGGVLEYEIPGSAEPGYAVVRAFGPGDDPDGAPEAVKRIAVSNPVYLHPKGFHVEPAKTSCTLHVAAGSPWIGGSIEFQQADGRPIDRRTVSLGAIRLTLPASARILLRKAGQKAGCSISPWKTGRSTNC